MIFIREKNKFSSITQKDKLLGLKIRQMEFGLIKMILEIMMIWLIMF